MIFGRHARPRLIGVIHLAPLPGSPSPSPGLDAVIARAVADAVALELGGADAIIVENFGDAPFAGSRVEPATVAAMTRVALAVRERAGRLPLGINVLRNDAIAALAIAAATGASFIRVNVHTGAMVTDQGTITGEARATLLERNRLGADVRIAADVMVKHAVPLGDWTIEQQASDASERGRADALIVTGSGTGKPLRPDDLVRVRSAVPEASLWAGSGVTPATAELVRGVDAAIVGTWLHADGHHDAPIDASRVMAVRKALDALTPP
jgi:membrane complex biogenesis BtpA family protein